MTEKQNDAKINGDKPEKAVNHAQKVQKEEKKEVMSNDARHKLEAKLTFLKRRVMEQYSLEKSRAVKKGREPRPISLYSKEIKELEELLK